LRGVGFDRFGGKLRTVELVHLFAVERALHAVGQRQRAGTSRGLRVGEAAIQIIVAERRELGVIGGDQGDVHVGNRNRLVAIIGDDKENGKESVVGEVDGKDFCLFRSVVRVGSDCNLLVAVKVVRRVIDGGAGHWPYEILRGEQERGHVECTE